MLTIKILYMRTLFFVLTCVIYTNLFSQTQANLNVVRHIVGEESIFDTSSNVVVHYIREHMEKTNCICYSTYDEKTNSPLYFTSDFFEVNEVGKKDVAYFYTTYTSDTSQTDEEFLKYVLNNIDDDFQERYVQEGVDYYNLNDIENFNFLVFTTEIFTEQTYFDVETFDAVTKQTLEPYKILVLIGYNN